jgi:aminoacyl tRNA synthase complex-interacting multifunctional protein 1
MSSFLFLLGCEAHDFALKCNLKPANMRGVKSFAMVLCVREIYAFSRTFVYLERQATSKDGKEGGIEFIKPPANSKPGDRVYFEGAEFEGKLFP